MLHPTVLLAAGQTQSFAYDANGNRTNATINAASTTYTYPSTSHKLTSLSGATSRSFTYDNAGNVTVSAGITYTYDGRGRMKQAGTTTYAVNGLGQRVKKTSGTDTFFAYDETGHLIGEYDATGAPIQETIWLGDLPVAVLKPKTGGGFDVFYVWADNLGTPRQITDTLNQSRWEWPNADPFGNNAPNENPAGLGTFSYNLRFPGQYYDSEKGSNYNYFRDYDPGIGRYVESDPIGLRSGALSTYAYVSGMPLVYVDPMGLAASTIQCDGKGDYEVVNINKGCDKACTEAHERTHIEHWKERYGADSCRNKQKGYLPLGGPNYSTFLDSSECLAYRIGRDCRLKLAGGGGCDCSAGIKRDEDQMKALKCSFK